MEPETPEFETAEEVPLTTLYLHIEYGDIPTAVLGIATGASEVEIRDAYRALALRIHPDKAPSERLRELHTLLFQKVQAAYNSLLEALDDEAGQDSRPKQLPETLASLHARNVAYREALRSVRERALQAKHAADRLKASQEANKKAKNERLAEKRELRAHMLKEEQAKRQNEIAKEKRKFGTQTGNPTKESTGTGGAKASSKDLSDWEEMEDDLEAKAALQPDESQKPQRTSLLSHNAGCTCNSDHTVPPTSSLRVTCLLCASEGSSGSLTSTLVKQSKAEEPYISNHHMATISTLVAPQQQPNLFAYPPSTNPSISQHTLIT